MPAGPQITAFERNLERFIDNQREILGLVEDFHERVTLARTGLEVPGKVEQATDRIGDAAGRLEAKLDLLARTPGLGAPATALGRAVEAVRRSFESVEAQARSLRVRIDQTGFIEDLKGIEEDLDALEAAIAERIATQESIRDAVSLTILGLDEAGPGASGPAAAIDAAAPPLNGAIGTLNDLYEDVKAAAESATDAVRIGVLSGASQLARDVERIEDALRTVTDPIDKAFSRLRPLASLLDAVGFVYNVTVKPAVDFVIDKLGIDDVMRRAVAPLLDALDFDVLDRMSDALSTIFSGFDRFTEDGFGASAWLDRIDSDLLAPLRDAEAGVIGFGTPQDDTVRGDAGIDLLSGLGGADTVLAGGGDDIILASASEDRTQGGAGFDRIVFSGNFAEYVWTQPVQGGAFVFSHAAPVRGRQNDGLETVEDVEAFVFRDTTLLRETVENNTFAASSARLDGTPRDDILLTGTILGVAFFGLAGDDRIVGGRSRDTLDGGADDDVLAPGLGDNEVIGGPGDDVWLFADDGGPSNTAITADLVVGEARGWGGVDRLSGIENLTNQDEGRDADLFGDARPNRLNGAARNDLLSGRGGSDTLSGGGGRDTLFGGAGSDLMFGGEGSDVLLGGPFESGEDVIDGGAGQDLLSYSTNFDAIGATIGLDRRLPDLGPGSSVRIAAATGRVERLDAAGRVAAVDRATGVESFLGSDGDDTLVGGLDADGEGLSIFGGDGSDMLSSAGAGVVDGGSGDDRLNATPGPRPVSFTSFRGGGGTDVLNLASIPSARWSISQSGGLQASLRGFSPNQTGDLAAASQQPTELLSGSFNDIDEVLLGDDDDRVFFNFSAMTIRGGGGADELNNSGNIGGGGAVRLFGDDGDDTVTFSARGEAHGGAGDDSLRIFATSRGSLVTGGAGDDHVALNRLSGGSVEGGPGFDTLALTNERVGVALDLAAGTVTSTDINGVQNTTLAGFEQIVGVDTRGDTLSGSAAGERLLGRGGADFLSGRGGDDELYGGRDRDLLDGGDGADTLHGGPGADTLDGGAGIDTASYAAVAPDGERAAPTAFAEFGALIDLRRGFAVAAGATDVLTAMENAIGSTGNDTLLGNADANVLDGGEGADYISAGGGDDILVGLGDDTLRGEDGDDVFALGPGNFEIDGGSGLDRIRFAETPVSWSADFATGRIEALFRVERPVWADDGGEAARVFRGRSITPREAREADPDFANSPDDLGRVLPAAGDPLEPLFRIRLESEIVSVAGRFDGVEEVVGGEGDDVLAGGPGRDVIDGGGGRNAISYADDAGPVRVRLATGLFRDGRGNADSVRRVQDATGSRFADDLAAAAAGSLLRGLGGRDRLTGLAGSDTLDGGAGADTMIGGAGRDAYVVNTRADLVVETVRPAGGGDAGGVDTIESSVSLDLNAYAGVRFVENLVLTGGRGIGAAGNALANRLTGNDGDNVLRGVGGNDTLTGGAGGDVLLGGAGRDAARYTGPAAVTVSLALAREQDTGGAGVDRLSGVEDLIGGNGADRLIGSTLANRIQGGGAADTLLGGGGDDTLSGGGGRDRLVGGQGADVLIGGAQGDVFVFGPRQSAPGARDAIRGFDRPGAAAGDRIDVSAIDADATTPGNQAFVFGSATGTGRLYARNEGAVTVVFGNTDADAAPEFAVAIVDGAVPASRYTAADFLL